MASILLIDDDDQLRGYLCAELKARGHTVESLDSAEDGLERVNRFDVVVLDNKMPRITGLEFLAEIRSRKIEVPVILMTASHTTASAIRATALGAVKYVVKPADWQPLVAVLETEIEAVLERVRESARLPSVRFPPREPSDSDGRTGLVGTSAPMLGVCSQIGQCAKDHSPVLIQGETGTGKELVAKAIHDESPRKDKALQPVNCGAIPSELAASQFFGYRKGAFTGADRDHIGFFEKANGSTLFLDEIGDMPPTQQVILLRVLQEGEFERIGGPTIEVDVRVVAATHCDLPRMIREGKFREDLYYRLSGSVIRLPPLRERLEDLPDLVDCFLAQLAAKGRPRPEIAEAAMQRLQTHDWPGNVRELEHVVEQASRACQGLQILPQHIVFTKDRVPKPEAGTEAEAIAGLQRAIAWALKKGGPNVWDDLRELLGQELAKAAREQCSDKTAAAKRAGMARGTLLKFLKEDDQKE